MRVSIRDLPMVETKGSTGGVTLAAAVHLHTAPTSRSVQPPGWVGCTTHTPWEPRCRSPATSPRWSSTHWC